MDPRFSSSVSVKIICIAFLLWSVSGRTVIDSFAKCRDPGVPRNGYRYVHGGDDFMAGSRVSFGCRAGYRLTGEQRVSCVYTHDAGDDTMAVGWSSKLPHCVPSSYLLFTKTDEGSVARNGILQKRQTGCSDNGDPENGFRLLPDGIGEGAVVTFGCNVGFNLVGDRDLVCRQGEWSGAWPVCSQAVDKAICGDPGSIFYVFGTRFVEGTLEGANVTYSCAQGLALIGDDTRTCLSNGTWSGSVPTCRIVNCGQPPGVRRGTAEYGNLGFNFTATYSCDKGHVLEGSKEVTCLQSGSWSTPPTCRAVRCPKLSNPANGIVRQSKQPVYLEEAVYLCDNLYGVVGNDTRVCMANGSWSGEAPVCEFGRCDELQNPQNGLVHYTSDTVNSIATYSCSIGYRLVGQVTRMCQVTGRWSKEAPICKPSVCTDITTPQHGSVVRSNENFVFSIAIHSCNAGYTLLGDERRKCQPKGIWSGNPPVCIVVQCPFLEVPINGNFSLSSRRCFKSEARYRCNEGYTLHGGDTIRTCQESREWSGVAPVCIISDPIRCPPLPNINNGQVEIKSQDVGGVATYSCNPGFILRGSNQRTCSPGGVWDGDEPTCVHPIRCPPLPNINNGQVEIRSQDVGGVATYSCDPGFILRGSNQRTCSPGGVWGGDEPTCVPDITVRCGELLDPAFGSVEYNSDTVGSIARYSCNAGYMLSGDRTRTCQDTGMWSGTQPTCQPVDCGSLDAPPNGDVEFNMTTFDSIAIYTCDPPFTLSGVDFRMCLEDGTWSGSPPTCQAEACPNLDDPRFGSVAFENETRPVGSVANYSCDPSYTLIGEPQRTCLNTSVWSGQAPTCELLECPDLNDPPNGIVRMKDVIPGSMAIYMCNPGFMPEGDSVRVCELVGEREAQWSGEEPTCTEITCPQLEDPRNGSVTITAQPPFVVGVTAVYLCDRGFEATGGPIRRICRADGTWSGTAPRCVPSRIRCPTLVPPAFGSIQIQGDGLLDSVAIYTCNLGYEVVGQSQRICELVGLVGEWSGEPPICRVLMCPVLRQPADGEVIIDSRIVNGTAFYVCDRGFMITGPVRRRCLPTGEWSGMETVCDPGPGTVSCGRLEDPPLGMVVHSSTVPGSVAVYVCQLGYMLEGGDGERRCQRNGTWDGVEPSCVVVDCGPLSDPANGIVLVQNTTLGTTARYECNVGYVLVGLTDEFRFCTVTGMWSDTDPTCDPVDCGTLLPPVNGVVDQSQGTQFRAVALYSCQEGYVLTPAESASRTCTDTGKWSGSEPKCEIRDATIDCGDLSPPTNGEVVLLNSSTGEGALAQYRCRAGYMVVGMEIRQCQMSGKWDGEAPMCIVRMCPPLEAPANGEVFVLGTIVNSSATYRCDAGFELVGLVRRVCRENGEWTGDDTLCLRKEDIECPILSPPLNGSVEVKNRSVGDVATYSCMSGFVLDGSPTRTCQTNGAWGGTPPTCEGIQCPDPGTPANGRRLGESFEVGDTVLFMCSDGYQLDGSMVLMCQEDGTWDHPTPTCILPSTSGSRRSIRESCSKNTSILDGRSNLCTCVGSRSMSCCRYRQEWSQLSAGEQLRYINAVKTAASDPKYRQIYARIMELYWEAFDSVVMDDVPETSQFFPWHRYYLQLYEDLLRVIDSSVTIPYWDWTHNPENPYNSMVFDQNFGFGDSVDNITLCVNSGPFQEGEFSVTPMAGGNCIRRAYRSFPFFNRQLLDIVLANPASSFNGFHSTLQLFFHLTIRCYIGGTMCTNFASEDPMYILLLAQLDRLLDWWQLQDDERAAVRYSEDTSPLIHTLEDDRLLVSQYSSNRDLPYSTSICYSDPPPLAPPESREPE